MTSRLTKKQKRVTKSREAVTEPKKGRPTKFTAEIADRICTGLAAGGSLRSLCRADDMPAESTVRGWALNDEGGFSAQYARAREIGYHGLFDEILAIADTTREGVKSVEKISGVEVTRADMIEHRRLQVDARKWILSKALPKIYGDKIAIEATHHHDASDLTDAELAARIKGELESLAGRGGKAPGEKKLH